MSGARRPNTETTARAASQGTPIRTHLLALIAALLVPIIVYAAILLNEYSDAERARIEEHAMDMARRLAAVVDRDLAQVIGALQALSMMQAFQELDQARAYDGARRFADTLGVNVTMKDRDGVHLVNTLVSPESERPRTLTEADIEAAATRQPVVSNLYTSSVTGRRVIAISVPIVRDGEVIGFAATSLPPERFRTLLADARTGGGWNASINDGNHVYIVNTNRPELVGAAAPDDFRPATTSAEGIWTGRNSRGEASLAAFARTSLAPWRVGVGVLETAVTAPMRQSLWFLAGTGVIGLGLSGLLAAVFARRLAGPLRTLANSAAGLGRGGAAALVKSEIREVSAISDALVSSAAELAYANQQRDNAAADLRAFADSLESQVRERTASLEHAHNQLLTEVAGRERMEDKLRQSQKMEAIGQLTGGVAHDFNNLLLVILSSLQMAQRRLETADATAVRRNLDNAMTAVTRASSLTHRLLAFSRQQPLQPVALAPGTLVSGMSELLRRSLSANITVETVFDDATWAIHADNSQLENAILNLALNARDAMPEGGTLTIATRNATLDAAYAASNPGSATGEHVLIALADTGVGMTPEVAARAFDPFFTTKPYGAGTGLGLSQVYGFIRQSGGHVRIVSAPGEGTTVEMYLPRFLGAVEAPAPRVAMPRAVHAEVQGTILMVEDDDAVRAVNGDTLRELGYTVIEAATPAEALRLLDGRTDIDLLFTDVVMPEINGRRLAEEALRRRPELRVLFTTGYAPDAAVHNGVLEPGVELLSKPFTVEDLADRLRKILREPAVV